MLVGGHDFFGCLRSSCIRHSASRSHQSCRGWPHGFANFLELTRIAGATSYNIYRGSSSGGESLQQSEVSGTTFEDSGLGDGQTYYYEVTAVNSGGESAKSSEASVTTKPAPTTTLNVTAGDSQVILNWNASPTATGYRLYRDTLGGPGGATNFLVTGTSFTDTGLVNGTTYYYQNGTDQCQRRKFRDWDNGLTATPASRK